MHRLAAMPGGWDPDTEGVIFVDQTPAPIVFLTAADTEIQALAQGIALLPQDFPPVRVVNILQLQQQLTIDTYAETVLDQARVILLRLLGGRAYWSYGLEVVQGVAQRTGAALVVMPGDDYPDPNLMGCSTVPLSLVDRVWRYFTTGGQENLRRALTLAAATWLGFGLEPPPPEPIPQVGLYPYSQSASLVPAPKVGLLFYRAHYLAGNTAVIDALCQALGDRQLEPVPIFVPSLREVATQQDVLTSLQLETGGIDLLLNTTGFSVAQLAEDQPRLDLWHQLDVPVLQVILSSSTVDQWQSQWRGLFPRDLAMNVALPEVDGRLITRAVSFKAVQTHHPTLETAVVGYAPQGDRIAFVADLAANWVQLRRTPPAQRRIALILANYPNRDGRLANGVGLDTPASCVALLKALDQAGYGLSPFPANGEALIQALTQGPTNDPESWGTRPVAQTLPAQAYRTYFATLPQAVQTGLRDRWGPPPDMDLAIPGIQLGQVFVGIQPARGYDRDPALNYHAPDLEPTHDYLGFYHWLRQEFGAQAMVHVGKHGNLEWLPGKSIALSQACYPEVALGPVPHFYPFIVNDPGEGSQAKRRAQAVILDHLTPPLTRAELYGPLEQLEHLIDEYYDAQNLDPKRLPLIRDRIQVLMQQENLSYDRPLNGKNQGSPGDFETLLVQTDGYLCELKEAQIRDGLHVLGQCPEGRLLRDLVVAIARSPHGTYQGLTRAIAQDWQLDLDPLTADPTLPLPQALQSHPHLGTCRNLGDVITVLEVEAANLVETLLGSRPLPALGPRVTQELSWIGDRLLPQLQATPQEITALLQGLDGHYVPSGPSGAPTRGRPDVLPTGRNFYAVDIRGIPTESAWDVGRRAAEALIERYTQEEGDYPQTLGLSLWGTATMRTGGDDIAEALALLGVQPVWEGPSRRVVDFEILPLTVLGRPRVDVTLRISGCFRDAFPNLISLFHQAVQAIAQLPESPAENPLVGRVQAETRHWQDEGLSPAKAAQRASYRVFGSKPGAYGAGLQGLIDSQHWQDDGDLARAYINWSCFAYTGDGGYSAAEAFTTRLQDLQIVLHNQDNREHDLLDSDDYYQFQGGLTAAVRSQQGHNPHIYFGDHSRPEKPRIRTLGEEIDRVYRSRVINPKWIAGVMRHGYKGAFELAATVDYLFAYDATTHQVANFMYGGITQAYLLDQSVRAFVQQHNPWALRDMAERLLEAHQRQLWQNPNPEVIEQLRAIALEAEARLEGPVDP